MQRQRVARVFLLGSVPFAQLTFRENLRDVEVCLQAGPSHYHRGERGKV